MKIIANMRNGVNYLITGVFVILFITSCTPQGFEITLDEQFKKAKAFTKGDILNITTGKMTRKWKLTEYGLITQSVTKGFTTQATPLQSDWNLTGILPKEAKGKLVALTAQKANDDGFTSDHLEVTAEFEYTEEGIAVKYLVWAYPNAPGLRTQLFVRKLANFQASADTVSQARAEYLPINTDGLETRLIGYYNHTQHRNNREDEILKEEIASDNAVHDWPSVIDVQSGESGLMLVQESHKCVNQPGVNSGAYHVDGTGVYASGLGIGLENLTDQYRPLWAYWLVAYEGGDSNRQFALKQFDRVRYPIDPKRDVYIMANSWGSGAAKDESLYASREVNILAEIQSQKDLGIDLQQVDDGWQGTQYRTWDVVAKATSKTYGEYEVYPEGWKNIKALAAKEGVRLGLWAAWKIPGEDLLKHYKTGGFTSYKLDFANLKDYETFHGFIDKIRNFILATNHEVRVNWDVTENPARIGYYFGREYGNIYLENRKPIQPAHVVYHPFLVLRDAWQVSKYTNLNKFQVSIQNIDRVNREVSDAYLHNHPYTVAIALMGSPIFFQETHYYTKAARDQIRPVIATYKQHRDEMYKGYVFPIGEQPDNASWPGFQNHNPETSTGYLTIFREINNKETTKSMKLHFLQDVTVELTNLITGETAEKTIDENGNMAFEIENPVDFRFYKYEIK